MQLRLPWNCWVGALHWRCKFRLPNLRKHELRESPCLPRSSLCYSHASSVSHKNILSHTIDEWCAISTWQWTNLPTNRLTQARNALPWQHADAGIAFCESEKDSWRVLVHACDLGRQDIDTLMNKMEYNTMKRLSKTILRISILLPKQDIRILFAFLETGMGKMTKLDWKIL